MFSRKIDLPFMPVYLSIETTRMCNLRCIMCEHTIDFTDDNNYMSKESFMKLLNNTPHLVGINLTGLGEPLLNPDFIDIVKIAKMRKLYVEFFTNGTLLNESIIKNLIKLRVDRVIFSLDAAEETTYRRIRGANYFNRVLNNIVNFINMRNVLHGRTIIAVNFVLQQINKDEVNKFIRLMRMINVDEIIINPIIPPNTTLNHLTVNKHQISFINASNINISPYVKGMSNLCPLPWLAPFISVEGYVFPCCFISGSGRYKQLLTMGGLGNVLQSKFKDIWYGVEYRRIRYEMLNLGRSYICEGCGMIS
jgi:MoaA/NifB/PqqE/SkfB family radical SAM enzyme